MTPILRIYLASSWRNPRQPAVLEALRDAGFEVYDFRNPGPGVEGFSWTQITDRPRPWDAATLQEVLVSNRAQEGFRHDHDAMEAADVFVLLLPCGRSAHLEAGWACGRGKPTFVLMEEPDEPELMYLEAVTVGGGVLGSVDDLIDALDALGDDVFDRRAAR